MPTNPCRVERTTLPGRVSIAPVPCRMIAVQVFEADPYAVSWCDVIGFLCPEEMEYVKRDTGDSSRKGATHEEMLDLGWRAAPPWNWSPDLWPVVAGGNADDEYPIRPLCERTRAANQLYETVVACTWPPADDPGQALRIAKELVRRKGDASRWVDFDAPGGAEGPS